MVTVKETSIDFIWHCQYEKNLSNKTLRFYTIDLKQFLAFLSEQDYPLELQLIDKNILKAYFHRLSEFKPKTIKRKVATLKAFFNFLEFEDRLLVNPFRKLRINIKEPKTLPTVMTIQEVRRFFTAVYKKRNTDRLLSPYKSFESLRNIAVVELLFATGVRVSELSGLLAKEIDLHAGFIKVKGKGNKERVIQICNKETISVLKEYSQEIQSYKNYTNHFFVNRIGMRLSEQSIRHLVRKLTSIADIKKRITPHVFRHSTATLLLEEGVDIKYIQNILGHSSIVTTQIYTHVNSEKQKAILKLKHPRKNFTMIIA